ncbi:MAG: hypothetical protein D6812_09420 [Deltaproteobacteria bacterium]|nr:MAG: hypothetical protein D6812_09420 [Deltaproteobacteria bacterium]
MKLLRSSLFLAILGMFAVIALAPAPCGGNGGEICDDGVDNDGDEFVDCHDFDCDTASNCEAMDANCQDGIDNDGNGFVDCDDFGCSQNCETADVCPGKENTVELCSDGIDNDDNGFADCDDFACSQNHCDEVRALCNTPE